MVVIHGGGGIDAVLQSIVLRLADQGYVAAAPELFHRQKDNAPAAPPASPPAGPPAGMPSRISQLKDAEVIADVNALVRHLEGLRGPGVSSIGITGFCMGGRVTYLMASQNPALKAAAAFYPASTMQSWGGGGSTPFDLTANISCPGRTREPCAPQGCLVNAA